MKIQKAAEDYLEAMLMLRESLGYIRSTDVAELLGVTKPSVSYATRRLRENGYITMEAEGPISLTPAGLEIAQRMYTRHRALASFFTAIGVDEKTALADACRIEHDISAATFEALCRHAEKMEGQGEPG